MLSMLGLLVLGGAFVGLLSGLLGVGGAVIIMPLLNVFFDRLGFSVDTTQHLSLGTSLATILFTSLSSVLAHRRYGSVRADIWKKMAPGIIAGTLGGALLAPHLPGLFLRGFFAFFVMLVGVHLLFNSTPRPKTGRLERAMLPVSILIGLISSLAGIAGTMLCVIFLVWAAIRRRGHVRRPELAHQPDRNPRICHRRVELPGASSLLRRFRVPSRDVLPAGFQHEHGRCRRTAGPFAAIADAGLAPLFRGRQYPSRSFDTPLRPFQMIPTQLKKQSRSSAPAYSNTPPSLRKTLPPGERTQKIPAGKPVGMFFFAGGPSVT